jgi:hypothetical protein
VANDIETNVDGDQDMTVRTMRTSLSADDVQRLVRSPDPEERASSARRICRRIAIGGLSEADQAAALYVLEYIMADAAETVRRALAITLKNSPHLPRELALRLIEETDSIAEPVLEWSPVLTSSKRERHRDRSALRSGRRWAPGWCAPLPNMDARPPSRPSRPITGPISIMCRTGRFYAGSATAKP